jgi:hypothetical protein
MFQTNVIERKKNTFHVQYFFRNRDVYEVTWKNIVEPIRPHKTIWRMRFERLISKDVNVGSQYVILIARPMQLWLKERTSML